MAGAPRATPATPAPIPVLKNLRRFDSMIESS